MNTLLLILFYSSLLLFVTGLIRPQLVLFFTKGERTRKKAALIYGLATIIIFITGVVIPTPGTTAKPEQDAIPSLAVPSASQPSPEAGLPNCFKEVKASPVRQTADQPDDTTGYQIHVLYVLPSDRTDRELDTNGTIATSVSAWENWLCNQTKGKAMRLDTYKGSLDITYVRLSVGENAIARGSDLPSSFYTGSTPKNQYAADAIGIRLKAMGFIQPKKLYAIYYDGINNYACGQGSDSIHAAFIYMHGDNPPSTACNVYRFATDPARPKSFDAVLMHELIHALGFVPKCAPHNTRDYNKDYQHATDDPSDIMSTTTTTWWGDPTKGVLDYNHDDYYEANIPGCPDFKNSAFLTGGGSELPPNW